MPVAIVNPFLVEPPAPPPGTIQIGSGASTYNRAPLYGFYDYGLFLYLFTSAELGALPRSISSIEFEMQSDQLRTATNQKVSIAHTTEVSISSSTRVDLTNINNTDLTACRSGFVWGIPSGGPTWRPVTFTTNFEYNGTSNIVLIWRNDDGYYLDNIGSSSNPLCLREAVTDAGLSWYKYTDTTFPADSATGTTVTTGRPNIKFNYD